MPEVMLTPLTDDARDAFVEEELANYADQQIREAGWPRDEALERARAELTPVLDRELAEAAAQGHRLWSATNRDGRVVGWLWVTPLDNVSESVAFLKQITVAETSRRHGYGRALLAALEDLLAGEGIDEPAFGNVPRRLRRTMICLPLLSLSEGSATYTASEGAPIEVSSHFRWHHQHDPRQRAGRPPG